MSFPKLNLYKKAITLYIHPESIFQWIAIEKFSVYNSEFFLRYYFKNSHFIPQNCGITKIGCIGAFK